MCNSEKTYPLRVGFFISTHNLVWLHYNEKIENNSVTKHYLGGLGGGGGEGNCILTDGGLGGDGNRISTDGGLGAVG